MSGIEARSWFWSAAYEIGLSRLVVTANIGCAPCGRQKI